MAMFEQVVTLQLQVLFCVLLLGNPLRPFPASAFKACGADLYVRVALTHHFLVLAAFTAAGLLLQATMEVRIAQAAAAAAARATATGAKDFDAEQEGVRCVAAGWRRRWLRGTLLLAVALSFAASVLAVVASEDGFRYRAGCDPAYDAGYRADSLMIGVFTLLHGFFAWVAVSQN